MAGPLSPCSQHRSVGNTHFAGGQFAAAIDEYSRALALRPDATLHGNRSAAHYRLGQHEEALRDADTALALDTTWVKGHYHRGRALSGLGRHFEAAEALQQCADSQPANRDVASALATARTAAVDVYYGPLTAGLPVAVRFVSAEKGKGVFALADFSAGQRVYSEYPVAWARLATCKGPATCCSQCLRTWLQPADLGQWTALWPGPYPDRAPAFKACPCCQAPSELYCSAHCWRQAWAGHHGYLCPGPDPTGQHPTSRLLALCRQTGRSNPLALARLYASVLARLDGSHPPPPPLPLPPVGSWPEPPTVLARPDPAPDPTEAQLRAAFQPFANFVSNPEPAPHDDTALALIKEALGRPALDPLLTLHMFRCLNGAFLRNAQSLLPVSPLHVHVQAAGSQQKALLKALGCEGDYGDLVATAQMQALCVEGTGLFELANSTNHNCEPNVASVSSHSSAHLDMVAIRPIKKGEELFISYIDESLPWAQRQAKLAAFYHFACACARCLARA